MIMLHLTQLRSGTQVPLFVLANKITVQPKVADSYSSVTKGCTVNGCDVLEEYEYVVDMVTSQAVQRMLVRRNQTEDAQ